MNYVKKFVIVTLLAVWTFPAVNSAHAATPAPAVPAPASAPAQPTEARAELVALADSMGHQTESRELAAREKQAPNLQDFKGGAVEVYIGSGAALVLIIILLIILL